ncbi:MAG: VWA domain-containing protein [Proteobacteria bacterium]|nr:VWA domain-containing protein [Pseudomonadota bacterium]
MGLTSALFLGGLLSLALPWLLHRMTAHDDKRIDVSSLYLMRPSETPANTVKKIRHPWLLATRLLLLTALCFSYAQPYLTDLLVAASERKPHRIIVIDTSVSMGAADGSSSLDQAKDQALDLLSELAVGQKAALITAATDVDLQTGLTADITAVRAAVNTIQPSEASASMSRLPARLTTLIDTLVAPTERVEVHLLSDFQASAMPHSFNQLVDGARWPLILHPVRPAPDNWGVSALTYQRDRNQLDVTIQSFAAGAASINVDLLQNDVRTGTQVAELQPFGNTLLSFDVESLRRTDRAWTVRLNLDDGLRADNVRYLAATAALGAPLPVFAPAEQPFTYIRAAVSAASGRFEPLLSDTLDDSEAPVLILLDPGVLPATADANVRRHLDRGGAVLIIAGEATRKAGRIPILDLKIAADRITQTRRGVIAADRTHPILTGFDGWRDTSVYQAVGVEGQAILTLDDNQPLLAEYPVRAGRLLLLTTALDPAWSNLVVQPGFVTWLNNTLAYLAEDMLPTDALVAQPFAIPAASVQLLDQAGKRVLSLSDSVGRPAVKVRNAGLYELRTPSHRRLLAVNVDPLEMDLRRASPELLEKWSAALANRASWASESVSAARPTDPAQTRTPLGPWLLLALAALVIIELLVANGGRSAQPSRNATV